MANLLAKGARVLKTLQRRSASSVITYRRGGSGAGLRVYGVRGVSDAVTVDSGGAAIDASVDDWIIAASDLLDNGVRFDPAPGDTITYGSTLYEVQALGGAPCFKWSDGFRLRYRIHVREVATE